MMKIKKTVHIWDIVILTVIIISASIIFLLSQNDGPATAEIITDGKLYATIDLNSVKEAYTLTLDNGMKIEISKGSIKVTDSDCNGKDCISCGELSSPGDIAVCVPNATVIKLRENGKGSVDAITY